jgi:hypothetical protein
MKRNESRQRSGRRKTLAALSVAAGFCAATAHAQSSVTLYGLIDAGIQYRTNEDGQHSAVNLQNYGVLPSQIGLTGVEDLGGGLQALFRLEQGINVNDGTATVPGYAFFRGAYVGLTGTFGTVTLGRQFSVLFDRTVFYDPLLYAAYSGQGVLVPLSANFIDNSVKFKTADYGGFSAEALAATGGVAGNSRSGRVLEIGAQYGGNGYGIGRKARCPGMWIPRDCSRPSARWPRIGTSRRFRCMAARSGKPDRSRRRKRWRGAGRAIRSITSSALRAGSIRPGRTRRASGIRRCSSRAAPMRCQSARWRM